MRKLRLIFCSFVAHSVLILDDSICQLLLLFCLITSVVSFPSYLFSSLRTQSHNDHVFLIEIQNGFRWMFACECEWLIWQVDVNNKCLSLPFMGKINQKKHERVISNSDLWPVFFCHTYVMHFQFLFFFSLFWLWFKNKTGKLLIEIEAVTKCVRRKIVFILREMSSVTAWYIFYFML